MKKERLDKLIASQGLLSRNDVKNMVRRGEVSVNGTIVRDSAVKVSYEDDIRVKGEKLFQTEFVYIMLNKPAGFVTATQDPKDATVMELLPETMKHLDLKPVGRLDKATEGLLLFTNDGDLLHRLISPKKEVPKVYYAKHEGTATGEDVQAFADGLTLRDGTACLPAKLEPLGPGESLVTVCEGKYHQVKRMFAAVGNHVEQLRRIRIGALKLDTALAEGECRELTSEELELVFKDE